MMIFLLCKMDIGVNNTRYTLSVEDAVDCLVTRDSYLAYALVLCIIDANKKHHEYIDINKYKLETQGALNVFESLLSEKCISKVVSNQPYIDKDDEQMDKILSSIPASNILPFMIETIFENGKQWQKEIISEQYKRDYSFKTASDVYYKITVDPRNYK